MLTFSGNIALNTCLQGDIKGYIVFSQIVQLACIALRNLSLDSKMTARLIIYYDGFYRAFAESICPHRSI